MDGFTLSEVPSELYYLPEVPLSDLYGEDAYGVWTLEIWDNRAGPPTNSAQLLALAAQLRARPQQSATGHHP